MKKKAAQEEEQRQRKIVRRKITKGQFLAILNKVAQPINLWLLEQSPIGGGNGKEHKGRE